MNENDWLEIIELITKLMLTNYITAETFLCDDRSGKFKKKIVR